jgi:hypothetical protein
MIDEIRKDFESENEIPEYLKYDEKENRYKINENAGNYSPKYLRQNMINAAWYSWIRAWRKYNGV